MLQQSTLVEIQPRKPRETAAAAAIHAFLCEFQAQGAEVGVVGKKMPLLTRLAGGIRAWKGSSKVTPAD